MDETEPPRLEKAGTVPVPRDAGTDGTAGWYVRHSAAALPGYLTERERGDVSKGLDGVVHYHMKTGGYPISASVVGNVAPHVSVVYVAETDTGRLFAFTIEQYVNGERVDAEGYDRQLSVDTDDALCAWPDCYPGVLAGRGDG